MSSRAQQRTKRSAPSKKEMARQRQRMKSTLLTALDSSADKVAVADDEQELRRQAALASRRSQKRSQERAATAIGSKMADPREDMKELQDDVDELRQNIFVLEGEIHDLEASQSMQFPTATEVANVSAAVGVLDARIAASVAASAIMTAATDIMNAWSA